MGRCCAPIFRLPGDSRHCFRLECIMDRAEADVQLSKRLDDIESKVWAITACSTAIHVMAFGHPHPRTAWRQCLRSGVWTCVTRWPMFAVRPHGLATMSCV